MSSSLTIPLLQISERPERWIKWHGKPRLAMPATLPKRVAGWLAAGFGPFSPYLSTYIFSASWWCTCWNYKFTAFPCNEPKDPKPNSLYFWAGWATPLHSSCLLTPGGRRSVAVVRVGWVLTTGGVRFGWVESMAAACVGVVVAWTLRWSIGIVAVAVAVGPIGVWGVAIALAVCAITGDSARHGCKEAEFVEFKRSAKAILFQTWAMTAMTAMKATYPCADPHQGHVTPLSVSAIAPWKFMVNVGDMMWHGMYSTRSSQSEFQRLMLPHFFCQIPDRPCIATLRWVKLGVHAAVTLIFVRLWELLILSADPWNLPANLRNENQVPQPSSTWLSTPTSTHHWFQYHYEIQRRAIQSPAPGVEHIWCFWIASPRVWRWTQRLRIDKVPYQQHPTTTFCCIERERWLRRSIPSVMLVQLSVGLRLTMRTMKDWMPEFH